MALGLFRKRPQEAAAPIVEPATEPVASAAPSENDSAKEILELL